MEKPAMSDPKQIEQELREYLEKEPNLNRADRLAFLQTIFNKHLEVTKLEHVVTYRDFFNIVSEAKRGYTKVQLPITLSRKEVAPNDTAHVVMIESFISYLSKMNLLKKVVKFDRTDRS